MEKNYTSNLDEIRVDNDKAVWYTVPNVEKRTTTRESKKNKLPKMWGITSENLSLV